MRRTGMSAFSINWTAATIFIVVIGGLGSLEGPVIGAVVFFVLRETLADHVFPIRRRLRLD